MKKLLLLTASLGLFVSTLSACSQPQEKGELNHKPIDGSWIGIGNAIGYDEDYSIDTITVTISEDGILTFQDGDQDTNDLSGAIFIDQDDSFLIKTYEDPSTLSLPTGWKELQAEDRISYSLLNEDHLILTYQGITYGFLKESSYLSYETSPLYELGENNVWYSNDGSRSNETSYELDLYNGYAELYSVSPNNTKALATNFFFLGYEGNLFHFYTNIRREKQLPALFKSAPDGFDFMDLTLICKDDSLTMTYQDQSLAFYNNVIYGLKTGGDSYQLCNKAFSFTEDDKKYNCYFAMQEGKETLYLYVSEITENEEKGEETNVICGEIAINEKQKNWIWYFDKKRSAKTANKDSDLYLKFSGLNGLKVAYTLSDSNLHLQTADATYDLILTDRIDNTKE